VLIGWWPWDLPSEREALRVPALNTGMRFDLTSCQVRRIGLRLGGD
jgi:hypothetical protein